MDVVRLSRSKSKSRSKSRSKSKAIESKSKAIESKFEKSTKLKTFTPDSPNFAEFNLKKKPWLSVEFIEHIKIRTHYTSK